jgi:hypothetical protein
MRVDRQGERREAGPPRDAVRTAQHLADTRDPGDAFLAYFGYLVEQAAANRGGGVGAGAAAAPDLGDMERALLRGAQEAGRIRRDVTHADVTALVAACAARGSEAARRRLVGIALTGLAPPPP